jgi:uncharacterized integral membrane protein
VKEVLRQHFKLSLFFFLLLFLAGRIGLFLHEFAGHALFWRLIGGRLTEFSLFVFGGGWVHYGWTPSTADASVFSLRLVELSGLTVELVAGVLLAVFAIIWNTNRSIRGLFAAASSVLIVHSLFYLVISTYYGCGDGRGLFAVLQGGIRQAFLFLTFCLTVAGAFLVSYAFSPAVRSWGGDCSSKKRVLVIVVCAFAAALLHGTLTIGEQIVVKDEVYAEIKTPENVRLKEEELSEYISAYTEEHGREPDQKNVGVVENELEQKYWQFPIEIPLGIAVLAAFIGGFFLPGRRDHDEPSPVAWKDIALLGCFSVSTVVLILVLNRL